MNTIKKLSVLTVVASTIFLVGCTSTPSKDLQPLAQCLTTKGAVMYGTNRCSHCQNQKKLFGEAFSAIKFVDCDANKNICELAGVRGYPTWSFADGSKLEGEQPLETLAAKAGCSVTGEEVNQVQEAPQAPIMTGAQPTPVMTGTEQLTGSVQTGVVPMTGN